MTPSLVAFPTYEARTEYAGVMLTVTAVGTDAATVEDAMARLVELLVHFDPNNPVSDLARANQRAGQPTDCSLETALLASVVGLAGDAIDVRLDTPSIVVPPGARIDPGRIAASLAMDMVVHDLEDAGASGAAVRVGDEWRVAGAAPYAGGWETALAGARSATSNGARSATGECWIRDRAILTFDLDVLHRLLTG